MTSKLGLLPIIFSLCNITAFFTAYTVAVFRGDVYPLWPYISDTGTYAPESCIFGELLTLSAFAGLATALVRYKFVENLQVCDRGVSCLNVVALAFGVISTIATTFVANFQETVIRSVHMPSSFILYGSAIVYCFLHVVITKKTDISLGPPLWLARLIFASLALVMLISVYCFGFAADLKGKLWYGNNTAERLVWKPNDPGWQLHIVSTISEWITGLAMIMYFLTFSKEFGTIQLNIKVEMMTASASDTNDVEPLFESCES